MNMTSANNQYSKIEVSKVLLHLLLLLLFGAGYIEPYLPNGRMYVAGTTGIIALTGVFFFNFQLNRVQKISIVDIVFLLYAIYTLCHFHVPIDLSHYINSFSLIAIWWCVRQYHRIPWSTIAVWATISGTVQTTIGMFQYCGVLESNHATFAATGTFNNPGIWGGYLAIMLALSLPGMLYMHGKRRRLMGMGCALIFVGICLSCSRAACLAVITASLLVLLPRRKRKYLLLTVLILFPIIGYALYLLRPASVEARWLIWQVGTKIFSQAPICGRGTGSFAAEYMPAQAEYLHTAPMEVQRMADDNLLSFNEVLLVLCEQGLLGLLLLGCLTYLILRILLRSKSKEQKALFLMPLLTIFVFSLFSYFSSIWSLFAFLPFVVACISVPSRTTAPLRLPSIFGATIGIFILIIGMLHIYNAHTWIKQYVDLQCNAPIPTFIDKTIRHDAFLSTALCESAWLIEDRQTLVEYAPTMEGYHQTAKWKIRIGENYESLGKPQQALFYYRQAHCMMPGLTLPLFAEFSLWRNMGDTQQARHLAEQIVHHTPKIKNNLTQHMKNEAQKYLLLHL